MIRVASLLALTLLLLAGCAGSAGSAKGRHIKWTPTVFNHESVVRFQSSTW